MGKIDVITGDNLEVLRSLAADAEGVKFDLIELDGPYGANLEGWDRLTESEYLDHYKARLALVREILQPWGVVFLFGWPEGCAEIKAWAHATGTLHLRRWISWFVNSSAHAGRKIQTILLMVSHRDADVVTEFRQALTAARKARGLTVVECHKETGIRPYARGGYIWFESENGKIPNHEEYKILKTFFDLPDRFDVIPSYTAMSGLTDIDVVRVPPERAHVLNDAGLRSKPVQLYWQLFKPTIPPYQARRALVLYGGSGNAAVAAAALGYDVTVVEMDPARAAKITGRTGDVKKWAGKAAQADFLNIGGKGLTVQPHLIE